ncbi:MAG: hypothetical protein ACT452_15995, partial [Microthrixaceae bacterium]
GAVSSETTGNSAYEGAVRDALKDMKVPQGSQLMLVGHSQGGMVADDFARAPGPYKVTHLITAGSPFVHLKPPPSGVRESLALVNRNDEVVKMGLPSVPLAGRPTHFFSDPSDPLLGHDAGSVYADELGRIERTGRGDEKEFLDDAKRSGYLKSPCGEGITYFKMSDRPGGGSW